MRCYPIHFLSGILIWIAWENVISLENRFVEEDVEGQIARLQGVMITGNSNFKRDVSFSETNTVWIDLASLPNSLQPLEEKLQSVVQNQPIDSSLLADLQKEVLRNCSDLGHHTVWVEIPEQDITEGVIVCNLKQARIGEIDFEGNDWFSATKVLEKLALSSGETLNEYNLLNQIGWLNQNPFHYSELVLSPGKEKGTTNVEILTKDRFPIRLYSGADNTGVQSTGESRLYGGISWGDAFFIDDLLTYQFTSNIDYDKFHNHLLTYTSYLPWQHIFQIYGGYAEIELKLAHFKRNGKDAQSSFRYKIPFQPYYTSFQQEIYFGFDYKYETSVLFFVSEIEPIQEANQIVNLTQEMFGYQFEYVGPRHEMTFQSEVYGSFGGWLPHQNSQEYNRLRSHAKPYYAYATFSFGDIYKFSNESSVAFLLRAQGASGALLQSEQFKLGGFNSVRGYQENVFISDNGVNVNIEYRTPRFHIVSRARDQLLFLAFMDYGWGYNYHPFDGIKKTAMLWSVGPGFRYSVSSYLNIRADYGFKLHHVKFDDHPLGMWHVGATLSY